MKRIDDHDLQVIAQQAGIEFAMLKAFIEVESSGRGFDPKTGKLLIQFEPTWFRRQSPYAPSGAWSVNRVDVQSREWVAFNDAFYKDPEGAMKSTSIGLPQIMGFHWALLGYSSVGEMWDDFKKGEYYQVKALVRFIEAKQNLYTAMQQKNFYRIAYIYNGSKFREMAKKWGREPYDISMKKAYEKYSAIK